MVYIEDDYGDDSSVVRVFRNRTFFGRYDRYTIPSFVLLLFGITVCGLSVADVAYTAIHYSPDTCNPAGAPASIRPCSGNHIYTYVSSGIWGGISLFINGIFGLYVPSWTVSYSWVFTGYKTFAIINFFAIVPAIVALNVLEITQNNGVFYLANNIMQITVDWDLVKSILPISIACLALLTEIVLFIVLCIVFCCRTPRGRPRFYDEYYYGGRSRRGGIDSWDYDRDYGSRDYVRPRAASRVYGAERPRRYVPAGQPDQILWPAMQPTAYPSGGGYAAGGYGGYGMQGAGMLGATTGVTGVYGGNFPQPVISTNPYGFYRSTAFNSPQVMGGFTPYGRFA